MVRKWPSLLVEKRPNERIKDHVEPGSRTCSPFSPVARCRSSTRGAPSHHPNLQLSRTTIHFWSGFSGGQGCVAQDWGQLLIFQGKSCSPFRAFTTTFHGHIERAARVGTYTRIIAESAKFEAAQTT